MTRLASFVRTAVRLGPTTADRAALLWRLSKNLRVRLGLARYHPDTVYVLHTRWGRVFLRDNFGDVTNLPKVWADDEYRVGTLPHDGVILDVGANIGLFAAWALAHNPGRVVHCFEPLEGNRGMIARNCPSAHIAPGGLSRTRATITLRVDAHSIMATTVATRWPTREETFEVVPLDEYAREHGIGRVAFLKIDTEGMEVDVLDGGRETLRRTDRVAMETHGEARHRDAIARLAAAGLVIDDAFRTGATGMIFASHR